MTTTEPGLTAEAEELTRAAEVLEDTGGLTDREVTPAVLRVLGPMLGRATIQECVAALLAAADDA